ncbi:MAG: CpaF/VirB11 family protein, partial [Myxococcales bacterium]|nr:CpaF/VirB11 family protein [Myxococcales bacterium]
LLSGVDLPLIAVRAQVASAVHLVVCCERFSDGSRKLTQVSEVLPLDERGEYRVQDLWRFEQTGREADGRVRGVFKSAGVKPTFFARFAAQGYADVEDSFFDGSTENAPLPPAAEEKRDTEPEQKPVSKPPPIAAKKQPAAAPSVPTASIELDPELQAEVEARLHTESTLITRNPLDRRDDDTEPGTRRRP